MATFTRVTDDLPYRIVGAERETITDVALDSSYPTGGEVCTPQNLGLDRVTSAISILKTTATTSVNIAASNYDITNSKLMVFDETPAQVASTANLAGAVVRVTAQGYGGGGP